MDFSSSVANYHVRYSSCGSTSGIEATQLKLVFPSTEDGICKIGVFGADPCAVGLTLTEDPYTDPDLSFDLIVDTLASITFPSVTISPSGCYTIIWTVHLTLDDSDLEVSHPLQFSLGATSLQISHSPSSYADRLSLFNLNGASGVNFYFQGTLSDPVPSTVTNK